MSNRNQHTISCIMRDTETDVTHSEYILKNHSSVSDAYKSRLLEKMYPSDIDLTHLYTQRSQEKGIMFVDIVDSTHIDDTYNTLQRIYSSFDNIIRPPCKHIDTVGDCYIIVCDPKDIKELVILAQEFKKVATKLSLHLRIGIHVGEVIGGVISKTAPKYSYYGNAMNYAARLQQCGKPDVITVSKDVFELLSIEYTFTKNYIFMKGYNEQEVYELIYPTQTVSAPRSETSALESATS